MNAFTYEGAELELFASARNWKRYWASRVSPYIGASVLEVGAGIGSNTRLLRTPGVVRWVCLEPDGKLAAKLDDALSREFAGKYSIVNDTLQNWHSDHEFDTILYIDVLEHIANDAAEVASAARLLANGGYLVVLAPAHMALMTPFDRAVGHHRRYTRRTLSQLAPASLELVRLEYLDCVGLIASAANAWLLRQEMPTAGQIACWDRGMVPISRMVDRLTGFQFGKSVLAVWRRQ